MGMLDAEHVSAKLEGELVENDPEDRYWLESARAAFQGSETWFDSSIRQEIEANYARFQSRHPAGSRYHTEDYAKRSKIFRPKTRTIIRNNEAAAAVAAFATDDVVHCGAPNKSDPTHRQAARLHQNLINYRLTNSIKWYQIFIGGVQDAQVTGVVISKQTWEFKERRIVEEVKRRDVQTGEIFSHTEIRYEVVRDRPHIELIPVEHMRFDSACDWTDPIGTSPYIIQLQPWYVYKVKQKMIDGGEKHSGPKFRYVPDGVLHAALSQDWDSVRRAREEGRVDRYDNDSHVLDYQTIWLQEHIQEEEDGDWVYYTLGGVVLLSDPVPIEEVYPHGRPYAMGSAVIEAHKIYPSGLPKLIEGLQDMSNDVANLRLDNVRMSLAGRYFVARGRGVDLRTLKRMVPGSSVMMNDPSRDVKWDRPSDTTQGSYEEQDRLNLDIDDIAGTYSPSSQVNGERRGLNQTVGGAEMLQAPSQMVQEFILRTIVETWAEPALKQIIKLSAFYETDEKVLQIAADASNIDIQTAFRLVATEVDLSINIGFGATNPQRRQERFLSAMRGTAEMAPDLFMQADRKEVVTELFGTVGLDGKRFFPTLSEEQEDPRIAQLQQQMSEMQRAIETKELERATRIEVAQISAATARERTQMDWHKFQAKQQADQRLAAVKFAIEEQRDEVDRQLKMEQSDVSRRQLLMQREALNKAIRDGEREWVLQLFQLGLLGPGAQTEPGFPDPAGKQLTGPMNRGPVDLDQGAIEMPGEDRAGVLSRDQYGDVPFAAQ